MDKCSKRRPYVCRNLCLHFQHSPMPIDLHVSKRADWLPLLILVLSSFAKEQNNLVNQSKSARYSAIVLDQCEDDVLTYLTPMNSNFGLC